MGLPFDGGIFENGFVTCPHHGFQYALDSGECLTTPQVQLQPHDVRVVGDRIRYRPADRVTPDDLAALRADAMAGAVVGVVALPLSMALLTAAAAAGPLRGIVRTRVGPVLEIRPVRQQRPKERRLVARQRMGRSEKMTADWDFLDGLDWDKTPPPPPKSAVLRKYPVASTSPVFGSYQRKAFRFSYATTSTPPPSWRRSSTGRPSSIPGS